MTDQTHADPGDELHEQATAMLRALPENTSPARVIAICGYAVTLAICGLPKDKRAEIFDGFCETLAEAIEDDE